MRIIKTVAILVPPANEDMSLPRLTIGVAREPRERFCSRARLITKPDQVADNMRVAGGLFDES